MELSAYAGPHQGIFHSAEATASRLVKGLSLAYYDMCVVVSSSLRQQAVCACMYVCFADGISHLLRRQRSPYRGAADLLLLGVPPGALFSLSLLSLVCRGRPSLTRCSPHRGLERVVCSQRRAPWPGSKAQAGGFSNLGLHLLPMRHPLIQFPE